MATQFAKLPGGKVQITRGSTKIIFDSTCNIFESPSNNKLLVISVDDNPFLDQGFLIDYTEVSVPECANRDELMYKLATEYFISCGAELADTSSFGHDAFGRQRVSTPDALFESHMSLNERTNLWETVLSGGGYFEYLPNQSSGLLKVGTANGDVCIREQHGYNVYFPGVSMYVLMTSVFGVAKAGVVRRIGYFNDSYGIFLEQTGTEINLVVRNKPSASVVETRIPQNAWNGDTLDGAGVTGKTLELSKNPIFMIDFQYLGTGSIRCAFKIEDQIIIAHEFKNSGVGDAVYMNSGNAPLRYEIRNTAETGSASELKQICAALKGEGSPKRLGIPASISNKVTSRTLTNGNRLSLISVRLKTSINGIANRATLVPDNVQIYSDNRLVFYELVHQMAHLNEAQLDGSPTWVSLNEYLEYSITGTSIGTGGRPLLTGYMDKDVTTKFDFKNLMTFALNAAGDQSDMLHLVCTPIGGNATLYGNIFAGILH